MYKEKVESPLLYCIEMMKETSQWLNFDFSLVISKHRNNIIV